MEKTGYITVFITMVMESMVLPVPGGPTNSTPFGIRAPMSRNFLGIFKKSTISINSSLPEDAFQWAVPEGVEVRPLANLLKGKKSR